MARFWKASEIRGVGEFEHLKPPSGRHWSNVIFVLHTTKTYGGMEVWLHLLYSSR